MTDAPRLVTERLVLLALDADALDALIVRDRARLEGLTGARFPEPLAAPPLMEDALPLMRDSLRTAPDDIGWWPWSIAVAATGEAVGMLGLAGRPDEAGNAVLGYTLYPACEGRGYATEAARAVIGWAFAQPGVRAVRATIPVGHTPSLRVAERLGMRRIGTAHDVEAGEIGIFEIRGGSAAQPPPEAGALAPARATPAPRPRQSGADSIRGGSPMATFILLSTLTDDGAETIQHNPERILKVNEELARMGVTVVNQWAVLGSFDFVSVVEAKDVLTIARVSAILASRGSSRFMSLPAIPIAEFIAGMKEHPSSED